MLVVVEVDERRLAGAVRTDDSKRLARCDRQIDIISHDHRSEALAQTLDLQHALEFSNETSESEHNRRAAPGAFCAPRLDFNRSTPFYRRPECWEQSGSR